MRFQGLNLNLLVALDALLTDQNVSQAALKIHLSQSAMSGALQRLREYFHDDLLIPTGRAMTLTPRAIQLTGPVRAALLQIKHTITAPPDFDLAVSERSFTLLASDYAIAVAVAQGVRRIAGKAPGIRLRIGPVQGGMVRMLERGEAHFLIGPPLYVSKAHPSTPIFEDEYVVVGWRDNPHLRDVLDEATYFALGHVAVELGPDRQTVFDSWFLQSGKKSRKVEVTAPHFSSVPHLLVGTERIGTMHRRMAELFAESLPLRIYPAPFEIPRIQQMLQWNAASEVDPAAMWVRGELVAAAATACPALPARQDAR